MNNRPSPKECCCCGGPAFGLQWFNRDIGYGICRKCVEWQRSRGVPESDIRMSCGDEGIHWGVQGHE